MSNTSANITNAYHDGHRMIAIGYTQPFINDKSPLINEMQTNSLFVPKEQYTSGDLLSLSWLQKGDIIKITPLDNEEDYMREESRSAVNNAEGRQTYRVHDKNSSLSNSFANAYSFSTNPTHSLPPCVGQAYQNTYSENLTKPLYSYTHLIFMAIESTPTKCMTVNQIYNWCETNFPFFKHSATGWKNSLRHNLSINKSFKRLPRDGRADSHERVAASNRTLFYESSVYFDELVSEEGPGRGAFWAIEPRERPNLLDSVKRNPFSLGISRVRPITINSIQPFTAVKPEVSRVDFAGYTGENAIKSSGASNLIISNSGLDSCNSLSLVDPCDNLTEMRMVTTYSTMPSEKTQANLSAQTTYSYLPLAISETESPSSQEAFNSSTFAFEPWPAEEEDKYQEMLRLLFDGHDAEGVRDSCASEGTVSAIGSGIDISTKPKKETKQRRKSSLNPTNENMCNQCKENAASTCRSCSLRLWNIHHSTSTLPTISTPMDAARVLSHVNKPGTYGSNSALDQVLDALDEDQEAPPPHWQKIALPEGEIFITPAPYLDHEYCHCQKHIRRPSDNCIIDAANSRLRQEKLHLLRAFVDPQAGLSFDVDSISMEAGDEDFERHTERSGGAEEGDYDEYPSPMYMKQIRRHAKQHKGASGSIKRLAKRSELHAPISKLRKRSSCSNRISRRSYSHFGAENRVALGYTDDADFYVGNDNYGPPPYTGHYQRRTRPSSHSEPFDGDEDRLYSGHFRRQFPYNHRVIRSNYSRTGESKPQTSSSNSFSTTRKRRLIELTRPRHDHRRLKKLKASEEAPYRIGDDQVHSEIDQLSASAQDVTSTFGSEHSTTQAAKILMNISQMKNFNIRPDLASTRTSQSSEDSLVASPASS